MPRNVVFVAPFPAETTMRFVRAVKRLPDVRLLGVVQTPPGGSDGDVYDDVVRVTEPLSYADIRDGVDVLQRRHGKIFRIVGILEAIMVQMAQARAHFGIEGTRPETAELFRDKSQMKVALAKGGLPVAKHRLLHNEEDARELAALIGFPMVLKPPAGMGAKSTFRVDSEEHLLNAIRGMGVSPRSPMLAEEFLKGREFSFETVTVNGTPQVCSISHYLPSCLEVLENPWIQWSCILPRDISGPEYAAAHAMGRNAIKVLGLDNGVTHMEWFQRKDESLVIGEIAQRPPGANISRMVGLAHDVDLYRAWARAVVDSEFDGPWERKYSVGCAYLRGMGRGRVAGVSGLHETHEALGKLIVEADIPSIGTPKSDGYEGDGYAIVRHSDTEVVKAAVKKIIETVKVHYA